MLVVPRDGDATMVIPRLEAPRVVEQPGVFALRPWDETEDPTAIVAELAGGRATAAVGDQMWARFLVELLPQMPGTEFRRAVDVVGPLRMVKDAAEIAALRAAGAAADRVADQLHAGEIPLVGRTEAQVSADISARLDRRGPRQGQLRHRRRRRERGQPAPPRRRPGDPRRRDRAVRLRRHDGRLLQRHHPLRVHRRRRRPRSPTPTPCSTRRSRRASPPAVVGTPCEDVDRAARRDHRRRRLRRATSSTAPATASAWRSTRTPTSSRATAARSTPGHAFSVEPGIYVPGRWGMRLEDIVVATADGPSRSTPPTTASSRSTPEPSAQPASAVGGRTVDSSAIGASTAVSSMRTSARVEAGQRPVVERAVGRRCRRSRDRRRTSPAGRRSSPSTPTGVADAAAASRRRRVGRAAWRRSPAPAGCR